MKRLNEYILEQSFDIDQIILEGKFWDKVKKILGFDKKKVAKTMNNWGDDLKTNFTTGQYIAAKSKDKEIKKAGEEMAKAAENGNEELYKEIFNKVEYFVKKVNAAADQMLLPFMNHYQLLRDLSNDLNKDDGKQLAEKFKKLIDEKWPDGGKDYDKEKNKVEKSPASEGPQGEESNNKENTNNSEGQPKIDPKKDSSNIGTTDDNKPAEVTPEQQDNAIKDTIKDDTDFYSPLAKAAGIDGNTLKDAVSKFINKAWKEAVKDENGNAVLKWKNGSIEGQKNMQDNLEDNIVKGLSAILCGIMIIKNKSLMQGVYDVIDPEGRGKEEIKKLLEIK